MIRSPHRERACVLRLPHADIAKQGVGLMLNRAFWPARDGIPF
jgi:hypothetical protein